MQDSYVELYLPFTEDPELLEKYIATSGLIRLGKVLEDLDSLAGSSKSSIRHLRSLKKNPTLTALSCTRALASQFRISTLLAVVQEKVQLRSTLSRRQSIDSISSRHSQLKPTTVSVAM